jgi:hypothetical protein
MKRLSVHMNTERRSTMRRSHQKAASEASSLAKQRPTPSSVEVSDGDEERAPKQRLSKSPHCDKTFGRKRRASQHAQRHTTKFPRHSPRLQSSSCSRRSCVSSQGHHDSRRKVCERSPAVDGALSRRGAEAVCPPTASRESTATSVRCA